MYHEEPKKEADLLDSLKIVEAYASQAGLAGLQGIKGLLRSGAETVRRSTEKVLNLKGNGLAAPLDNMLSGVVRAGVDRAKEFRLIDKIDFRKTPPLLNDIEGDRLFKSDIIDDLDSRIGLSAPFIEEIERIGAACYDRGVSAESLKAFLECDEVLNLLVSEVLNSEDSVYRGGNIKAIAGSIVDSLIRKMEKRISQTKKQSVDGGTEDSLKRKIIFFEHEYDPREKRYTVANFIKELEKSFPEYDILGWLVKNKELLVKLIRGKEGANPKHHVREIIDEVYIKRGQVNPEQFIDMHLEDFLQIYDAQGIEEIPTFITKGLGLDKQNLHGALIVDLSEMEHFFDESMAGLQTPGNSLIQLREKLAQSCFRKMKSQNHQIDKIIIIGNGFSSYRDCENAEEAESVLGQAIIDNCRIVSSHIDVRNLLSDPKAIPPEIAKNHAEWFDQEGELKPRSYNRYLRSVFGQMVSSKDEDFTPENFRKLRTRITEIFERITMYLSSVTNSLNISGIQMPSITEVNDYAELVKICCTSEDIRERFAARRKIELAFLIYSCLITPRYVYQDYEARAVKKVLEGQGGLEIQSDESVILKFLDNEDGTIGKIYPGDSGRDFPQNQKSLKLIPANFAGVKCGLLPTNGDDFEYMGKKSIPSMITNLINEDNKRAKEMTDVLRMTFVVDSMEDLTKVQQHLENHYISFGRRLKMEDRYAKTSEKDQFAVSSNAAKDSEYRALRYVVDVVVPDENVDKYEKDEIPTYAVPIEIRVLLREDVMKEKSDHHPASHKNYERKRLALALRSLAPKEIFPELYTEEKAHPDDVFSKKKTKLKTREEHGE